MANGRESEKYVAEIRRLLPSDIGMLPLRNIVMSATYLLQRATGIRLMASAEQIKALLKSDMDGDDDRFFSVAMQVAAHEARLGHGKLAEQLRAMIDDAKGRRGVSPPVPIGRPVANWRISWRRPIRRTGWAR